MHMYIHACSTLEGWSGTPAEENMSDAQVSCPSVLSARRWQRASSGQRSVAVEDVPRQVRYT